MLPKEIAVLFLKMAGGGNVREAYEKFVAPDFIHHNQYFKGDRASLMAAMEEAHKKSPNKSIDVKHVYESGDSVITHSRVTRKNAAEPDIAVVHIFRLKNGKVAELWDLGQPMMKDSPNENGMF
jgi:predicted SnoaL-like aldol condensation-catalyzing enzyme